ncbi:hypothetical protein pb186bvf_005964 [Paramecium bursaria]
MIQRMSSEYFSQICAPHLRLIYLQLDKVLEEAHLKEQQTLTQDDINQEELRIDFNCDGQDLHSNVILIRHALAWHNYIKRVYNIQGNIYSYQLMDPPLHKYGLWQCESMKKIIHEIDFSIVYVSPLQRTVQSAQLLFKDHPNKDKIKFILQPLCSERLANHFQMYKWGRLEELKKTNGNPIQFDLSLIDSEFWQFKLLGIEKYIQGLKPDSDSQNQLMVDNFIKQGARFFAETKENTFKRSLQLKELIKQQKGRVGVISHSQFITAFITNKKVKNGSMYGIQI